MGVNGHYHCMTNVTSNCLAFVRSPTVTLNDNAYILEELMWNNATVLSVYSIVLTLEIIEFYQYALQSTARRSFDFEI